MRSANPSDECGRVDGTNVGDTDNLRWRRDPAPNSADDNPAAVVKRSVAPRFVFDPGVAPRRDVNPGAVAVRSPADDGGVREPHGAVFGHGAPAAVFIE